jgi:hypothetical protein
VAALVRFVVRLGWGCDGGGGADFRISGVDVFWLGYGKKDGGYGRGGHWVKMGAFWGQCLWCGV